MIKKSIGILFLLPLTLLLVQYSVRVAMAQCIGGILESTSKFVSIDKDKITAIADSDNRIKAYRINKATKITDSAGNKISLSALKREIPLL